MGDFPEKLQENGEKIPATYCVTGANGFIGSWLVKILLQNGFRVHATLRNPAKSLYLLSLWTGSDRLRLFRADLREEGSFDEAVKGCDGVFHVAASMSFGVDDRENIEEYVQSNIINPGINGTINLLKSCLKSKSVRRVVLTSSISTLTAKDKDGKRRSIVDESCQVQVEHVWKTKPSGWVYALSKLLSEEAAYKFASENGIDIVSVITSTVAGPFLTSNVPSSIRFLLSPISSDHDLFRILAAVNERMGSIAIVHTNDICRAHIFLMETAKATGRYLCCATSCALPKLVECISRQYRCTNHQRWVDDEEQKMVTCEISSKKLRDLGFEYEHGMEDIIHETIASCVENGFLSPN